MISEHLIAVLISFIIYIFLFITYFGWGKIVALSLNFKNENNQLPTYYVWLGWAITLFLFQVIHLFFPLKATVVLPVFFIGVVYSVFDFIKFKRFDLGRYSVSNTLSIISLSIFFLILAYWVASRSMMPASNYDSGLYHFNAVKWINSYAIIPGLGNLHGRLAFNHSFYAYVSTLNFYPYFEHGRSIANSFLFLLTIGTMVNLLMPMLKKPTLLLKAHPFRYFPIISITLVLVYFGLTSNGFESPSPDLTSIILQSVIFIVFVVGLSMWVDGNKKLDWIAVFLSVLAVTAITVKLSNLIFSCIVLSVVVLYAFKTNSKKIAIKTVVLCSAILIVWCVRSVILSGAPLYPSTIGYLSFDWSVSLTSINEEADMIYGWARKPGVHYSEVLGSWNWFKSWLEKVTHDKAKVFFPVLIGLSFIAITTLIELLKKEARIKFAEWLVLFPSIIGLVYWFFSAPDIRFAHALFFILTISSSILLLTSARVYFTKIGYSILLVLVFMISNNYLIQTIKSWSWSIQNISKTGYYSIKKVPLNLKETKSGLKIYLPQAGDQCWDSPIPSANHFNENLMLRDENDISKGFMIRKE